MTSVRVSAKTIDVTSSGGQVTVVGARQAVNVDAGRSTVTVTLPGPQGPQGDPAPLAQLTDVAISSPADGDVLAWDPAVGKWTNRPITYNG